MGPLEQRGWLSKIAWIRLHAVFRRAGLDGPSSGQPSTGIAVIRGGPARPFLAPVFEKYAQPDQISRRFLERVAAIATFTLARTGEPRFERISRQMRLTPEMRIAHSNDLDV